MAKHLPTDTLARLVEKLDALLANRSPTLLAARSPTQAKALRARFGITDEDNDEESLLALARELVALKKRRG